MQPGGAHWDVVHRLDPAALCPGVKAPGAFLLQSRGWQGPDLPFSPLGGLRGLLSRGGPGRQHQECADGVCRHGWTGSELGLHDPVSLGLLRRDRTRGGLALCGVGEHITASSEDLRSRTWVTQGEHPLSDVVRLWVPLRIHCYGASKRKSWWCAACQEDADTKLERTLHLYPRGNHPA